MIYSLKGLRSHKENLKRYERNLLEYVKLQLSASGLAFNKRIGYDETFEIKVGKETYYYQAKYGILQKEDKNMGGMSKCHTIPRSVILDAIGKEWDFEDEVEIDEALAYIKKVEEVK